MSDGPAFGHEPPTPAELKAERKRARRKERAAAERAGGRALDRLADDAVEQALRLAESVADAPTVAASERAIDVAVPTRDAASYVRHRINDALAAGEWLAEVEVWIWDVDTSMRPPLTDHGAQSGIEIRLEQPRRR